MANFEIINLGCPKNLVDGEYLAGILTKKAFNLNNGKIVFLNTCAFISSAVSESKKHIKKLIKLKQKGEIDKICITGCLVQREKENILKEFPEVDFILSYDAIPYVDKVLSGELIPNTFHQPTYILDSKTPRLLSTKHYAYVKIGEGCSRKCTFCTIPQIRGKFRKRTLEDILKEISHIASQNIKEIILVAQDLTLYGKNLIKLVNALSRVKEIKWIRSFYLHPYGVATNPDIIKAMADSNFVPYFELPIQHISDEILTKMGRQGGKKSILKAIDIICSVFSNPSIRTEIIVGFPGEKDSHFAELLNFIEEAPFARIGVFPYHNEPNTPASLLPNQLPQKTIQERYSIASKVAFKKFTDFQKNLKEKVVEAIIEKIQNGYAQGRTIYDAPDIDGEIIIKNTSPEKLTEGNFISTKITRVLNNGTLIGTPL